MYTHSLAHNYMCAASPDYEHNYHYITDSIIFQICAIIRGKRFDFVVIYSNVWIIVSLWSSKQQAAFIVLIIKS